MITGIDPKSTPGHGNCIPLPTPFERSEVGNFHHLIADGGLENKSTGLENINFLIWYVMCFWKVKDGHLTILTDCPIFPHSDLSFRTVQKKSMTVCAMCEIYTKYILKCVRKRTGMEPETALLRISIVGTGKSIDFYFYIIV